MAVATATVIQVPVYSVNSNNIINRQLYPYGMPMAFGTASLGVQPNSFSTLNDLEAGRQSGAALVYSALSHPAYGSSVFYSNLTVANIMTLAGLAP